MRKLRVLVGVPSGAMWQAEFGMSLTNLVSYFAVQRVQGFNAQELRVANVRSSILPKNRADLVRLALKAQVDYLLFLDTDHVFPPSLLHQLIYRDKPVVALNCQTKTTPSNPTARRRSGSPLGEVVYSGLKATGLEEVWRVGTGVMLLRRDVLEKVPPGNWAITYRAEEGEYQGEDWNFCQALQDLDIPIYVDHDLSKAVGHVGNFTYTHDHVIEVPYDENRGR